MEAKTATWWLDLADTAKKGKGYAQLVYVVDEDNDNDFTEDEIKKTQVYKTTVQAALVATSEVTPSGYETWLEVLGGYTARVESAKLAAEAAKAAALAAQAAAEASEDNASASESAAASSAASAAGSATAAAGSATSAAGSASSAGTAAAQAAASETSASGSASAAATSATNAAGSATNAAGYATSAAGSASSAATSATNAAASASSASSDAASAAESASDAADAADSAETSAGSASTSATNAAASATSAGNSATAAAGSATSASGSASTATTKASEASASATSASESATAAAASAASASADAESIAESAEQIAINKADISDLKEEINDKPNWTVGSAEQLVSDEASASDVTPYTFRRSGGGLIPFKFTREELAKVVGGTVAWNQLYGKHSGCSIKSGDSVNITATVDSDGYANISGTPNATTVIEVTNSPGGSAMPANNVCLLLCDGKMDGMEWGRIGFGYTTNSYYMNKHNAEFNCGARIRLTANTTYNIKVRFSTYNLTRLFSSPTIADYIYSLETATAGTGIAFFKKLFPNQYYAPDAGSLQSVCVGAHECVGFNQWDEEWKAGHMQAGQEVSDGTYRLISKDYVDVLPNTTYCFSAPSSNGATIYGYDKDKNYTGLLFDNNMGVSADRVFVTFTTGANVCFIRFQMYAFYGQTSSLTYKNDICINISKTTGTPKNGDYVPYQKHTYALDSTKTLRGRFYLDSNNQLRADGDIYLPIGGIERKWGYKLLDSSSWFAEVSQQTTADGQKYVAYINKSGKGISAESGFLAISSKFMYVVNSTSVSGLKQMQFNGAGTYLRFVLPDGITTLAELNTWLASNPIELAYQLATPTTETADPYTAVQICDSDGTEEFVDALVEAGTRDVAIPAGTETTYFEDMAGKLAELPPIPSAPSTDGTYTLQAVVSSGNVTYSWTS